MAEKKNTAKKIEAPKKAEGADKVEVVEAPEVAAPVVEAPEVAAAPVMASAVTVEADPSDPEYIPFEAQQHVANARKLYRKEPWLVQTVLEDLGPEGMITRDAVRERLTAFLNTPVV